MKSSYHADVPLEESVKNFRREFSKEPGLVTCNQDTYKLLDFSDNYWPTVCGIPLLADPTVKDKVIWLHTLPAQITTIITDQFHK